METQKIEELFQDYNNPLISFKEFLGKHGISERSFRRLKRDNKWSTKRRTQTPKYRTILGKRFNDLTIIEITTIKPYRSRGYAVKCECHRCGRKDYVALPYDIIKNKVKSCGCDRSGYHLIGKNNPKFTGIEAISGNRWRLIQLHAQKRGLTFEITIEKAWELFQKQNQRCALTGEIIFFSPTNTRRSEGTASLDRIDSQLGYTEANVQWVHKTVNLMKRDLTEKQFLDTCRKVHEYASQT